MKKLQGLAAIMVLSAGMAFGQSQNGTVSGVITDASGAVVAGATVTLTNVATGAVRTVKTDSAGIYDIEGLPPQMYKVSVSASGFSTTTTAPFTVAVGSDNKVSAKLAVGQADTQVEVSANSLAGINLENAEQSQVIDQQQIVQLPTETRNPYDFVALSGNLQADPSATNRGVGFNIGGTRSASTEILLDGIENTYLFSVGVATATPVDAVQEYRVITSNYGPEYGRASGGVVNVVTKSGTNAFHGTAWEFYRPSTFASNSYYNNANGIKLGRFVRNEFGFVVGGPIKRDKLFFFGGNEWLRVRSSNVQQYYVPTAQFIAASNANTQNFFKQYGAISGTPSGKVLTLGQIGGATGSVSSAFATDRGTLEASQPTVFNDAFPVLQQINVTAPLDAGAGSPVNQYNPIGRIDFNLSSATQMYARYVLYNQQFFPGSGNLSPYAGFTTATSFRSHNLVYGITHTFSPKLTTQIQLGLLRTNSNSPLGANPAGPTLFINSGAAPSVANNQLVFPGYNEGNAGNGLPSGGPQNDIIVSPVVTYLKGRHTFTVGGQYTYIRDNHTFAIYENAQESLLVSGTNTALVNFVNGNFNYFQANINPQGKFPCAKNLVTGLTPGVSAGTTIDPTCAITTPITQPDFSRSNRYHEQAYFFNEEWKATSRLTINAGLRYEIYGTQHNKNSALDSNFYFGTTGTLQDRIRAGKILNVNSAPPAGVQNPGGKLWNTNYKQFAPRIAFAYDLTGDGKTSLRGGYGISYERNFGNVTYNVALNPPAQFAISITNNDNSGNPFPISTGVVGPFSSQAGLQKALPQASARAVDPRIKPAYSQFYTLALERRLAHNTAASVAYTGTRGIHNYSIANYNRSYYGQTYEGDSTFYPVSTGQPVSATYPTGQPNTNRLNPQYTSVNVRGADGDSYYNAVNVSYQAANLAGSGLTVTGNYTFSHSTDNTSSTFTDGQSNGDVGGVAYFDPYNHALDHGNSDFDIRHRITTGIVYSMPDFGMHGLLRTLAGGFKLAGIFQASTGTPFSMYDCGVPNVTACTRVRFSTPQPHARTGNSVATGTPDQFAYITFPTYQLPGATNTKTGAPATYRNDAAYPQYRDARTPGKTIINPNTDHAYTVTGYADLPTITNIGDTFPGMSARNAFRGPGSFSFNADASKEFKIGERLGVELRAELYNVLNHANSYLNLSGANDVNNTPYAQIYKNGPGQGGNRQLQLAGKITF